MLTVRRPQPPLGGGGAALQTSACSEIRSPGRQDGGRGRREVSRGGQLRLRRKIISDQHGDLKLRQRRGVRSEPRRPGRRGGPPGSKAPHGVGRMQQVSGEDSGRPSSVQACRRSPVCLSDTGWTLLGEQHRVGWPGSRPLWSREPGPEISHLPLPTHRFVPSEPGLYLLHDHLFRSSGWSPPGL